MRQIPFGRPLIGEEEKRAVLEALSSPTLVHGPKAEKFEEEFVGFTGGGRAVSVSSCTAALHLAYFYLGIGPGDEVIVPALTHTATAHAVEFTGAKPVFVDADGVTGNLDLHEMEAAISSRTKALSLVHFLGLPVDMSGFMKIAEAGGLFVVEDCALALGSFFKGTHAGLFGDVGCFSFYPVKHMTTAEGGMLLTRRPEIAESIKRLKAFGVDRSPQERAIPGVYDVTALGYNYRLNEMQAALGRVQLKRLPGFLDRRQENFTVLSRELAEIEEITQLPDGQGDFISSHYCLSVILPDRLLPRRFEVVQALKWAGIGTSVYYPRPVPHMTYYRNKYGYGDRSFPKASQVSYGSIALPVGPHLDGDDMKYIAAAMKEAIKEVSKQ